MSTAVLDRPPAVRVLPVPRAEPPADEEWSHDDRLEPAMTAPTLPLRLYPTPDLRRRTPTRAGPAGAEWAVPGVAGGGHAGRAGDPFAGPGEIALIPVGDATGEAQADGSGGRPEPPAALAEIRVATQRFMSTFLEVTAGFRPLTHLRPHCRADRYGRITDHLRGGTTERNSPAHRGAAALAGRVLIVGRTAAGSPPRAGRVTQRAPGDRLTLRRVQTCQVSDVAAEIVVVVSRRGKCAAMAFRLERTGGRWLCVDLEIV